MGIENEQNASRDEQFLRLLMSHQERIYAFILSLVHNGNDAEDLMQDVTAVMWRKFDTFRPGTSFTGWGITIARMLVLKFFEKNKSSKLSFAPDLEEKIALAATERVTSEGEDLLRILKVCLSKLNARDYGLIKRRYIEKKPTKEIAGELDIPPHRMYRIMGKIHEMLRFCVRRSLSIQERA